MKYRSEATIKKKKRARLTAFCSAGALLLAIAGVALWYFLAHSPKDQAPAKDYPIMVGGIMINSRPTRVVSLSPMLSELIYSLPAGDVLVGVSEYSDKHGADIPWVGTPLLPNVARIIELAPEYVVCQTPLSAQNREKLEQAGIKITELGGPTTLDGIRQLYTALGQMLLGETRGAAAGSAVASRLLDNIAAYGRGVQGDRYSFALLPNLSGMSATPDTVEYALFSPLFRPVSTDKTGWATTKEDLVAQNPDVVLVPDTYTAEDLAAAGLADLNAVKNGRVFYIDYTLIDTFSPRLLFTVAQIANALYTVTPVPPQPAASSQPSSQAASSQAGSTATATAGGADR